MSLAIGGGYVAPGVILTGTIVGEKYWVGALSGSDNPQDPGKANYGWRWRVRFIDGGIHEGVPDQDLPLCTSLTHNGATPYFRENDRVEVLHKGGGKYIIIGKLPVVGAAFTSGTVKLTKPSLLEQPISNLPPNISEAFLRLNGLNVLDDRNNKETITSITGACSDKSEYDGVQTALKNFIATVDTIKNYTTTYTAAATKIVSDIQGEVQRTASIIAGFMQSFFQRIRAYIIEKIKKGIESVKNNLHPSDKRAVNEATNKAIDTCSCLFDKILDRAFPVVEQFLNDVINRFVNVPMCAIESAVGSLVANVSQDIGQGIDNALGPVKSALGSIGQVVGQIFEVADFVTSVLGFFTCDSGKPLCPEVKEWGLLDGPNPKEVADFSNVVTNFNLSGGTQQLLGGLTSSGLGTSPGSLGYALGLGTGPAPSASPCNIGPVECGPPKVIFIGGGGKGTVANAIISATGSILGVDIVSAGSTYKSPPFVYFDDPCGNGSGAYAQAFLDSNGSLTSVSVNSGGSGYLSTKNGSVGGNKSTKVPANNSAASVPPQAPPAPATPQAAAPQISTKALNGFTLEVTPSIITEGQSFSIKLIPPSSVTVGDVFTAKITTDSPGKDSVTAGLSATYVFNKKLPPVVDKNGVKEIAVVTIPTVSDTIQEKNEKLTIEIVEVPGLLTTVEVNDNNSSPYTSASSTIADFSYEVQQSISVKEGETAQVVIRRTGKNLDVETTVNYEIFNDEARYGSNDPRVAKDGTHFLYPKDSKGVRNSKGSITFAKMQKDYIVNIITLSSVALKEPNVDSREIRFQISKNTKSTVLEDFSKGECSIIINERKPPEVDSGVPLYQAPLVNRVKALKETGLFDPSAKQVVKFKDAGQVPGEIYVGSLPEVKLFLSELNNLPSPLTIESVENVERLQALALDAVLLLYIQTVGGKNAIVAPNIIRSIEFVTDINEFLNAFKDTGGAAPKTQNKTKDNRTGLILEDRYTYSAYKTTKENIPIYWELSNITNDDIENYSVLIRSDELKFAGSPTIYWNIRNIDPLFTSKQLVTRNNRTIDAQYGNEIPTKLTFAPGFGSGPNSTIIDAVRPLPSSRVPDPQIGYVAPELPSKIVGLSPAEQSKTYKYTITVVAYIKDVFGGGIISNSIEFFVEG